MSQNQELFQKINMYEYFVAWITKLNYTIEKISIVQNKHKQTVKIKKYVEKS